MQKVKCSTCLGHAVMPYWDETFGWQEEGCLDCEGRGYNLEEIPDGLIEYDRQGEYVGIIPA